MKIISGKFRGRSINFIKNLNTRPLKNAVRENIFNILEHSRLVKVNIENSNILDLYSGIGSFGIECISRGAKNITFVERDFNAINILKKNLIGLSNLNNIKIHNDSVENILKKQFKEKFNIFFLDPPFRDLNLNFNIANIKNNKIYKKKSYSDNPPRKEN